MTTPGEASQQHKGEPPRERWDQILANARTKATEEALAKYRDPQTGRDLLQVAQLLSQDFPGTLAQLIDEAVGDDRFADGITAKAAALLNARKQKGKLDAEPEADFQTAEGVPFYSADQLRKWHEWNNRQTERKFGEQYKPLMELQNRFQKMEQRAQDEKKAFSVAKQRGDLWKSMPMFEENKAAILERQQAIYTEMVGAGRSDDPDMPWEAMQKAYAEVIQTQAIPKLQAKQTETLVASAQHKRAGSTTDPGAASAPARPPKFRTPDEALDYAFSQAQS